MSFQLVRDVLCNRYYPVHVCPAESTLKRYLKYKIAVQVKKTIIIHIIFQLYHTNVTKLVPLTGQPVLFGGFFLQCQDFGGS